MGECMTKRILHHPVKPIHLFAVFFMVFAVPLFGHSKSGLTGLRNRKKVHIDHLTIRLVHQSGMTFWVRSSIATDSSILILGVPVQKDMFSNDNGRSLNQRYGTETRDTTIILNRSNFDSLLVTKKRRSFGNNHMDALAGVGLSFGLVLSVAASVGMARDGNWIGASIPVGLAGVAVLLLKARMKNRLKPHIMYPLKE